MRKALPIIIVISGFLILATALYLIWLPAPQASQQTTSFPTSVTGFSLTQHINGKEAIDSINQLHGKEFPLQDGVVAVYGEQNATLWVSVAASQNEASELTSLMVERIAEGNSPFVQKGVLDFNGVLVYYLEGLGQNHYYWQSGNLVLWLAVDAEYAGDALMETLAFYR